MYNYSPLRNLLTSQGHSVKWLMREVGFSTNVAVALNNDRAVTIAVLADICRYLNVTIDQVVQILLD